MQTVVLAYIPALHQGYYQLFLHAAKPRKLVLIPPSLARQFAPVHKDLHALDVNLIKQAIVSWQVFDEVLIADEQLLVELNAASTPLLIPDEVVSHELAAQFLSNCPVSVNSIFLRWDRKNATTAYQPASHPITEDAFAQKMLKIAESEGQKSADWWRQVGAVIVSGSEVLAQTHNTHLPSEQQPNIEGDGRAQFHKGEHIEATTAIHAEAKLIAEAAAAGTSLAGCDLYLTDFPCPPCAKLIAHAGIKRLYYRDSYAVFDGERVLTTAGVEIFQVKTTTE